MEGRKPVPVNHPKVSEKDRKIAERIKGFIMQACSINRACNITKNGQSMLVFGVVISGQHRPKRRRTSLVQ